MWQDHQPLYVLLGRMAAFFNTLVPGRIRYVLSRHLPGCLSFILLFISCNAPLMVQTATDRDLVSDVLLGAFLSNTLVAASGANGIGQMNEQDGLRFTEQKTGYVPSSDHQTPMRPLFSRGTARSNAPKYFTGDNVQAELSVMRFPLNVRTGPGSTSYGLQIGADFRLYKGLFLGFEGAGNMGIRQTILALYHFRLSYEFCTTLRSGRSLLISPNLGYNILTMNETGRSAISQANYWSCGSTVAFELTHKLFLFAALTVADLSLNSPNSFRPAIVSPGFGVLLKR